MSEGTIIKFVDPVHDIGASLLNVEKPARYAGGEYGRLAASGAPLQTLIAFPDLYEIGMSNQALRIIYNSLNRIPGVSCDRAFAPAPDFEQLLRDNGLPLYGLDTGISLKSLDLLLFTLGYELGISGILAMLDVSGIPLHSDQRGDDDPLVIAGGPAVSNPLPYSAFIDAFWIGEAEAGFFDLAQELLEIKQGGGRRTAMFNHIQRHPHIWVKGKEKAVRAVDLTFTVRDESPAVFPIPSMKIVHPHGILEIMRGCPNGCRFCHAGYWYRPMRQKSQEALVREAEAFITRGGWREISLSSLSSGDYAGIGDLVDALNGRFSGRHVSFQLPSLRVSTFSLSLLEKVSLTRRSGLTFAVETPRDFWQLALNKQITADSVVEIIREAKRRGWRGAKFYFMIGLPLPPDREGEGGTPVSEEEEIVNFVSAVAKRTSMHFNINVGIFVPKPHTPYQWARQIDNETAAAKLDYIRSNLKRQGHKVSVSDPLISMLEGILSRGDERAGDMVEQAFHAGSRLDAWQEFIAQDAWRAILEHNAGMADEFLADKDPAAPLPWQSVHSGVAPAYLRAEFEKSNRGEMTANCAENCASRCGVCVGNKGIVRNLSRKDASNLRFAAQRDTRPSQTTGLPQASGTETLKDERNAQATPETSRLGAFARDHGNKSDPTIWRLLFSFAKEGSAVFHGHLSLIEVFSMAMGRAGLDVLYTQGFNPLAKLEIVSPLSIGISAGAEIAAVDFSHEISPDEFMAHMNAALPEGIQINRAEVFCIPAGSKKHSLSSLLWGFGYAQPDGMTAYIPASGEKAYREQYPLFSLRRACVLAKNPLVGENAAEQPWASYFDIYRHLYCKKTVRHGIIYPEYEGVKMRLITRSDFDGLACGALLEALGLVDEWLFVHPKDIQDGLIQATKNDVVANVPYIQGCGLWFDHHSSEEERLGKDFQFEGASKRAPSCAHVIYEYYGGEEKLGKYAEMIKYVDKMDSADLTVDEIMHPSGWILLGFISDPRTGLGRIHNFTISNFELMKKLAKDMYSQSIGDILASSDVKERIDAYFDQHNKFIEMVKKHAKVEGNAIYVDLREVETIYAGNRFLLYTLYPDQNISVWVVDGKKKVNTVVTVGYSIINKTATVDVGSLMLKYGGGGHKAVGTCQVAYENTDKIITEIIAAVK